MRHCLRYLQIWEMRIVKRPEQYHMFTMVLKNMQHTMSAKNSIMWQYLQLMIGKY